MPLLGLKPTGSAARRRFEASVTVQADHLCPALYRHLFSEVYPVSFVLPPGLPAVGLDPVNLEV